MRVKRILGLWHREASFSLSWADTNRIKKISLNVPETNERAISLYKTYGFEAEGILKKEKLLSDGNYYNTVVMGRFHD